MAELLVVTTKIVQEKLSSAWNQLLHFLMIAEERETVQQLQLYF